MSTQNETLRWPTNLDRSGIEKRLVTIREIAKASGPLEITALLEGFEHASSAQLGSKIIAALTWLQTRPEHAEITTQFEMVAMNLKNLK